MQEVPPEQAMPHAPQLRLLVWVSTHVPPHEVSPAPQVQTPPTHVCWAEHTVVHVPQWAPFVCRSTQVPLQLV
jgi:hypothetical protein